MEDYALFFAGNCQLQYISAVYGAVTSADRYFVGHRFNVNVALDGAWAKHVERKEFLDEARKVRSEGKRVILVVQETSRKAYGQRMEKKRDLFDDQILIPHLHFSSLWPHRRLKTELDKLSDKRISRLFDWERHEMLDKYRRCGVEHPEEFADMQWEHSKAELRFYHPGHFTGEMFAEVLAAMSGAVSDRLPEYEALLAALRRSDGIYQNSTHPISPRIGPILGLKWSETELYQSWLAMDAAGGSDEIRAALDRAEAVLADGAQLGVVNRPFQSHFLSAVGQANLRLGRRDRGVVQLEQATVALKGYGPLVRRTLSVATRFKRLDVVERILVEVAPDLEVTGKKHPGYDAFVQSVLELPTGRATLSRITERTDESTWVHQYLKSMMAPS